MTTNLSRFVLNKFFQDVRNYNISQKRFQGYKAVMFKQSEKPLQMQVNKVKKLEKKQVRVQVHYCSMNSNDVQDFKSGQMKENFTPGYELSGEVLEVGSEVTPDVITVGERVAVLSRNRGGFAEQCVVEGGDVWRLPSKVKERDAAILIFGHTNALYAFSNLCTLKDNTRLLISTGPGGMGLAAIDVAANVYKTKPTGVCESEELAALVRERGAFQTTTFKNKSLVKEFLGADVVYDAVGGSTHKILSSCVKQGGIVFYAGHLNSQISSPPLNSWLSVVNIEGLRQTNFQLYRSLVSDTIELADQGLISAYVSAQYELDDIDKAVSFIEEKKCTGKVLIKVLD